MIAFKAHPWFNITPWKYICCRVSDRSQEMGCNSLVPRLLAEIAMCRTLIPPETRLTPCHLDFKKVQSSFFSLLSLLQFCPVLQFIHLLKQFIIIPLLSKPIPTVNTAKFSPSFWGYFLHFMSILFFYKYTLLQYIRSWAQVFLKFHFSTQFRRLVLFSCFLQTNIIYSLQNATNHNTDKFEKSFIFFLLFLYL